MKIEPPMFPGDQSFGVVGDIDNRRNRGLKTHVKISHGTPGV